MASHIAPLGYAVFRCPEGGDESFLGVASTLAEARRLSSRHGLARSLWDTARLAGHCGGSYPPPDHYGEPYAWFGRRGECCACPILPQENDQ